LGHTLAEKALGRGTEVEFGFAHSSALVDDRAVHDGVLAVRHSPAPETHLRGISGVEKNVLFMVLYV
jgi:hypothetical protein